VVSLKKINECSAEAVSAETIHPITHSLLVGDRGYVCSG